MYTHFFHSHKNTNTLKMFFAHSYGTVIVGYIMFKDFLYFIKNNVIYTIEKY